MTDEFNTENIIQTEKLIRAGDHELFLSFRDDQHAIVFSDWLHEEGWDLFKAYYSGHPNVTG